MNGSNRRQYIQINEKEKTSLETISRGFPQGTNFRTTPISFICERLKKCFKHIEPNNVCR